MMIKRMFRIEKTPRFLIIYSSTLNLNYVMYKQKVTSFKKKCDNGIFIDVQRHTIFIRYTIGKGYLNHPDFKHLDFIALSNIFIYYHVV